MISRWLHRHGRKKCLVFCNGWGMDHNPFRVLGSEGYDVLACSDYSDVQSKPDIEYLAERYDDLLLMGWSMGVLCGRNQFERDSEFFKRRIAVNGTLRLVDDAFGIPEEIFRATFENFDEETLKRFYQRMCRPGGDFSAFMANAPQRSLASQKCELDVVAKEMGESNGADAFYSDVIISKKDLIVPTRNQHRFWSTREVKSIEGPHFPFYKWKSWDEMIEDFG